jgi:hypothetical protein
MLGRLKAYKAEILINKRGTIDGRGKVAEVRDLEAI